MVTSLNRPDYLQEACSSILDQDFADLEVLICDDASDVPEARDRANALAASDPRVRVLQNETRLGQFRTVVKASKMVDGEYFAILNDDDRWEPGFLSALVPPLDADPRLVASFCDHNIVDEHGRIDSEKTERGSRDCHRANLRPGRHEDGARLAFELSAFPTVVASLFRRDAINWDRYRSASMDVIGFYDLWLQVCVLHDRAHVWYEPQRLSSYRVHGGQLSGQRSIPLARAKAWILEEALNGGTMQTTASAIAKGLGRIDHVLGMTHLRAGNYSAARIFLRRALASRSSWPRSLAGLVLASSARLRSVARLAKT